MTSTELERVQTSAVVSFTPEQVDTLRTTLCSELDDNELQLFLAICQQQELDPFRKEIYATKTKRNKKLPSGQWVEEWILTPIASIDAFRSKAQNSGQYAGQHAPQWTANGRDWVDVWLESTPPAACRVSVLRHDWTEPLTVVYTWREYTGGRPSKMQEKMPAHMLAKATEALALRKAFPRVLGGIYTTEEMAGSEPRVAGEVEVVRNQAPAAQLPPAEASPTADADVVASLVAAAAALDPDDKLALTEWSAANGVLWKQRDVWSATTAQMVADRIAEFSVEDVAADAVEVEEPEAEPKQDAGVQVLEQELQAEPVERVAANGAKIPPNPAAAPKPSSRRRTSSPTRAA